MAAHAGVLEQSEPLLHFQRFAAVAQLGRRQRGRVETRQRREALGGADTGAQRVLPALAVGDRLLPGVADEERQQLLGVGLVLARAQHGGAGDVDQVAGGAGVVVVERRVGAARALLVVQAIPVV